jgi:hypothetical protein
MLSKYVTTWATFPGQDFIFLKCYQVTVKLRGMYRDFSPNPLHIHSFPHYWHPAPDVAINEPTFTYFYHLKFVVTLGFTHGIAHNMGLNNCLVRFVYHYIIQCVCVCVCVCISVCVSVCVCYWGLDRGLDTW